MMFFEDFIKQWDGKTSDFDGKYSGQCVDLYRFYCQDVLGIPQSPSVVGAADIWNNFLKDYFDAIKNAPENFPLNGDVIIWNKNAGGGYGHVGMVFSATANAFKSFDQHWRLDNKSHIESHDYKNVLGWLRPKPQQPDLKDQLESCLTDREKFWKERDAANENVKKMEGKLSTLETQLDELDNTHKGLLRDLANKLGTTQDISYIVAAVENLNEKVGVANKTVKTRDSEIALHVKEASKVYGSSLT